MHACADILLKPVLNFLIVLQGQALVVGVSASAFALLLDWVTDGTFCLLHALILPAAALVTASVASAALGLLMISVIVGSRCLGINPDNIATPIAASLGDLVTLSILAYTSKAIYSISQFNSEWHCTTTVGQWLCPCPCPLHPSFLPPSPPLPLPPDPSAPPSRPLCPALPTPLTCSPSGSHCLPHRVLPRFAPTLVLCGLLEQDHQGGGLLRAAACLHCHGYQQVCLLVGGCGWA